MPTLNPRINVTLPPSLDALVARMATHQRVSKSQVLRELLEAAEPALQRAVTLMDAARAASTEARAGLARRLDKGIDDAEDTMAVLLSRLDRAQADLVSQAEAVQGRRPARRKAQRAAPAVAANDPPTSNRGVRSPKRATARGKPPSGKGGRS